MSNENKNNEQSTLSTEETKFNLAFNPKQDDIWFVDHREVFRRGFSQLTSEQKDKVLVNLLVRSETNLLHGILDTSELAETKLANHEVWKQKEELTLKKVIIIGGFIVGVVLVAGVIIAIAKGGLLSESGNLNSILNVVGAYWQSLFGAIPPIKD